MKPCGLQAWSELRSPDIVSGLYERCLHVSSKCSNDFRVQRDTLQIISLSVTDGEHKHQVNARRIRNQQYGVSHRLVLMTSCASMCSVMLCPASPLADAIGINNGSGKCVGG